MILQDHHEVPSALGLRDNCIYLAPDGTMQPYATGTAFLKSATTDPELMDGRTLALRTVSGPQDVHYPAWEMHPDGDELLILTSGSLSVELREEAVGRAPLSPHAAFIVPAGVWHRLIVHEPSVLIAITPRHNTAHAKG